MSTPKGEETIFAEALRLPSEDRAAYLAEATKGNPQLREEVESLLCGYGAGDFLEQVAAPQFRQTLHVNVAVTEKPGDIIGRYKLLQQIGEGGCGVVYMAEQTEPVRRRVALKIIKLGMDTKSVIARFEAERQALALMDHPNIAKVLDAGATETGRPYFVMELVRGMKITDYCDEKKLPPRERLDLFIQVCQAIQHAHQKGIIHRDIKPSNILVSMNDGVLIPKVIDFGIAKATTGQQLTDKTLFTAFEQFIGTPAYMSPEQAVITNVDIDTRSDIYALGVLLYELLTGKTPFDPKELFAVGLDEMRRTIRETEPPKPSTRVSTLPGGEQGTTAHRRGVDAPKLVTELRGDLDWIVMKALEKDRARRYETANGLAMDIQRHLNNEPVVARPPSTAYRFQKLVHRNKLAFAAAGAIAMALIVGLAISMWMFFKEKQARQRAVAAENTAKTESSKSRQVAQFLQEMLNGVGPSAALGRDTKMLREILDKTAERVGRDLKDQPQVEAELRNTIGEVYFAIGAFQKAAEMHRAALAIRQSLFGDEHLDVASSLNNLGVAIDYQKKFSEAEAPLRKALSMRRKYLGKEHPDLATSLHNVAHVLVALNKLAEADPLCIEALAMRRKLFGNEHLEVARSLVQLGFLRQKKGLLFEAETMFREALAMRRKLLSNEHPEVGHSLGYLAGVLLERGELREAEAAQSEALTIQRKLFDDDFSGLGDSLIRMGRVLQAQGRLAEAETFFREAVNNRRNLEPSHPDAFKAHGFLIGVLNAQGKFGEAETIIRQTAERGYPDAQNALAWPMAASEDPKLRDGPTAVRLAEKAVIVTNRKNFIFLNTLAAAYAEAGQFAKAVTVQQEAIALVQDEEAQRELAFRLKLFEANSPFRISAFDAGDLGLLALRLLEVGKFVEAEPPARECLAIREKNMPDHWRTFNARSMLGGSLLGQKKYAEAEPLLLSAVEGLTQRQNQIPPEGKPRIWETLHRLTQLYEKTNRPERAIEWNQKLAEFEFALPLPARADARARRGQFAEAAADLAKAKETNPDDHGLWHGLAGLLVASGQLDAYHEHCRKSVERFGKSTEPTIAERIAKDCLILPNSGGDLGVVSKMADTAAAVTNHWATPWFQFAKGLAEYRQGRFAGAVEWINKTLTREGKWLLLDFQTYMVLAMAQHQLKQTDQARAAFAKGAQIEGTRLPTLESGDIGSNWLDWIIAHALMSEAKALIEDVPESKAQMK